MQRSMRPDLRLWVETATAKHMRGGVPIASLHTFLVSRALGQLLWYWRYDVPGRWDRMNLKADWSLIGRQLTQFTALDIQEGVDVSVPRVYEALNAGGWDSLALLPEVIWEWIEQLTCLTPGEWERVPELVTALLNSEVMCPICKVHGRLAEVTEVKAAPDPFMFGTADSLHLKCWKCQSSVPFDVPLI